MEHFKQLISDPFSRRSFLKRMGAAGLGAAAVSLLDGKGGMLGGRQALAAGTTRGGNANFPGITGKNINDIVVNFALTLEILEADLYRQALNQAAGLALSTPLAADSTTYSQSVGNGTLDSAAAGAGFQYLVDFAYVEAAHRDFLSALLTSVHDTPTTANPDGYAFPNGPGTTLSAILTNILAVEETGVRAYLGALPFLTNLKVYALTAGTIYSTEARHSAAINFILGNDAGPAKMTNDLQVTATYPSDNTFEYYLEPSTVLSAASVYFITNVNSANTING